MTKVSPKQIELFPLDTIPTKATFVDPRPLPIRLAEQEHFSLQYHSSNGKTYFSVQDWIAGISKTDNPRDFWNKLKKRLSPEQQNELSTQCLQLPYHSSNGKTYQMDFASAEGLYMITQRMEANTGIRDQVLTFLAKSGEFVDLIARDKKAAKAATKVLTARHAIREKSVEKRKSFTQAATETHRNRKPFYGALTNAIYHKTFRTLNEETAKDEIANALGLSAKEAKHLRDYLNDAALSAVVMSEEFATAKMYSMGRSLSTEEQLGIVRFCARTVAATAHSLAAYANVDLLTGLPLLASGGVQ